MSAGIPKLTDQQKATLNDLFWDVVVNEINKGCPKKLRAWIAKFAVNDTAKFMKEWGKLQPKDLNIKEETTLRVIKTGPGKREIPDDLPVLMDEEGSNVVAETSTDVN